MKRCFRQKQDLEPPKDPEKDKGLSTDGAQENVDIDDIIQEIETQQETLKVRGLDPAGSK
jgi:hypothetical protein